MKHEQWQRLEELFARAVALSVEEREEFLARACAGDPDLRRRLDELLEHDRDATDLLAQPVAEAARSLADSVRIVGGGQRIGPYSIIRELGRGGMGSVYLAVRDDDEYRKQVAIKVTRAGALEADLLRRFRSERQILASLDHPSIARLLDGGTTEAGLPYVVMEYVEGDPVDSYCDRERLTVEDRLRIFRTICSAVQYAHRSLIVHRDLKPANILVTPEGEPKLLDFGIAKLLQPELSEQSVAVTATSVRLLTPEYASPEQVRGDTITTASDVYSLGVLLYQLLAGRLPYRLKTRSPGEMERVICEQDPVRPSAASAQTDDAESTSPTQPPEETARRRSLPAERLRRRLSGDLDTIVLRALAKEPSRRYESAEQLSDDIHRHLVGLPVRARPDTWRYRSGKFVLRHRWGVAAFAALFVLICGSSISLLWQSRRIAAERDRAVAAEERARTEATTSEQVTEFMVGLFEVVDPAESRGREIPVREILDRGARQIRTGLQGEPEVQARLMATMGQAYANLGLHENALPLAEEALERRRKIYGDEHPEVARSLTNVGTLHQGRGEYAEAERDLVAALEMRQRLLGPVHADIVEGLNSLGTLRSAQGRYEEAEALHREALAMARQVHGDKHVQVSTCMGDLAWNLHQLGQYAEAEQLHRQALAMQRELLGEDHPKVGTSLNSLGQLLSRMGRFEEAQGILRQYVELSRKLYGEDSVNYGLALNNLSVTLKELGDAKAAESLQRQALSIFRERYGEEHPLALTSLNNLANLRHDQGDYEEAEALHRKALALHRKVLGADHPRVADSLNNLANLLWDKGEYDGAEPLAREALALDRKALGAEHPYVAMDLNNLAAILRDRGDYDEAETLFLQAIEMGRRVMDPQHPDLAVCEGEYGLLLIRTGRLQQAEERIRTALGIFEEAHPPEHFHIDMARSMLGECLAAMKRYGEAEPLVLEGYLGLEKKLGPKAGLTRRARQRVISLYRSMGVPEKAAPYLDRR